MTHNMNYYNINKKNREIQEAFYEFVHNICLYFYENLSIKAPEDQEYKTTQAIPKKKKESIMNVIFNKDYKSETENEYTEEELIFLDELTDTMKFQSFVFGFLQSYNPIDLYKIPLTFTEGFLSIISRRKEQIIKKYTKINFFNLIDSLYIEGGIIERKIINFDDINFNYFKKYKNIFDREIYDRTKSKYFSDKRHLIKFISGKTNALMKESGNQRVLIYQTYELDDRLLLKYCHLIKNLESEKTFYGSFFIEENLLKTININDIEATIENYSVNSQLLSDSDICCANIILLFTLSLKLLREAMDCQSFLGILFQNFIIFRKYYSILLRMIYRLYQEQKNFASTLCFYPCINSIRIKKLVPNEDLMYIINLFNKINIGELLNPKEENKNKKSEDNIPNIIEGQIKESPITTQNLYVYHNFTKNRFVHEEEIIIYLNKNNDQVEVKVGSGERIIPKIKFNIKNYTFNSFFYSQKILLDSLNNTFNRYIENLDDNVLGTKTILDACLNVFIFMRNHDEFKGKEDLFEVLNHIFYIFLNQLIELKSIEEKKNP